MIMYWISFVKRIHKIDDTRLFFWQVDKFSDPERMKLEAEKRDDVICISALSGEGITEFCSSGEIEGLYGMGGSLDPV
ncbi:hypothetical protein PS2_042226 [Malus domestica]